jgi:large subunit ribosomal protein L10
LALSKERKEELVGQYTELLRESKGLIFTEYRGLTNQQLTKLRRAIRDANGAYHVAKLTLLKRAMEDAGFTIPEGLGGAPVGVGFALEEVPALAKALRAYAKESDLFSIRGGVMGPMIMTPAQVESLADLPSLDVLRAQILGLLDAPAASLVGVIQAGVSQVVNVIDAYVREHGGSPAASDGASGEAATEAEEASAAEEAPVEAEAEAEAVDAGEADAASASDEPAGE